jgi:tetratricopeptide (TPR) repeat protein
MKFLWLLLLIPSAAFAQSGSLQTMEKSSRMQEGDALVRENKFEEAVDAYRGAVGVSHDVDAQALLRIAEVHSWMRNYAAAKATIAEGLERDPENQDFQNARSEIERRRGTHVMLGVGGNEIDFTRSVWGARAWYGGVDWLDIEAGTSQTDKEVYRRSNMWMNAYLFPHYLAYVRIGLQQKSYVYPQSTIALPDDNAYGTVPDVQLEVGYHYRGEDYAALEWEFFTPNFYWDRGVRARNYKIGGVVRNRIAGPVYGQVFAAILHDPDPESFALDISTRSIASFSYAPHTLVGGALGLTDGNWAGEIKFIPDRDLDRSLAWSLIGSVQYNTGGVTLRYDGLYDRYPASSSRQAAAAQAHMLTGSFDVLPAFALTPGVKVLLRDGTFVVPLLSAHLKTSL